MRSWRALSPALTAGQAFHASNDSTMTNAIEAQRISSPSGRIGFLAWTSSTFSAASSNVASTAVP